jgi:hypothetical protein
MHTAKSRLMLTHVAVGCLLTLSSSACDARRPNMPSHPDITREPRQRQLAPAAARAWRSNHFGRRVRRHRGVSAAHRGRDVGFDDSDFVSAWTFTDASGRYLLCGLPETRLTSFAATMPSSPYPNAVSYTTIQAGSDAVLDIEVTR